MSILRKSRTPMKRVIIAGLCVGLAIAAAETADKAKRAAAGPKGGVKAPGVLIPRERLKFDAEIRVDAPGLVGMGEMAIVPSRPKDLLARIDLKANKADDPITGVTQPCSGTVTAFGSLWAASCGAQTAIRIDVKSWRIAATLAIGAGDVLHGLAATAESVWMLTDNKTTLARIDPASNQVVAEIRLPAGCNAIESGEDALWVACPEDNAVLRVDANKNLVEKRIEVSKSPRALAVGEGSVWVLCDKEGKIDRIDAKTNKVVKTVETGVAAGGGNMAFADGSLWVTQAGFPLTRVDPGVEPGSERVAQQFWGEGGGIVAAGPGAVWLSNVKEGTVWRLDPKRVRATLAE